MKLHKLIDYINEELEDAEKYAIACKVSESTEAKEIFKSLSAQELTHADKLRELMMKYVKESDIRDHTVIAKFIYSSVSEKAEKIKSILRE